MAGKDYVAHVAGLLEEVKTTYRQLSATTILPTDPPARGTFEERVCTHYRCETKYLIARTLLQLLLQVRHDKTKEYDSMESNRHSVERLQKEQELMRMIDYLEP
jgi:hypothetical protein